MDKCLKDVSSCDAYIGLFAWRYGYIPPEQKKSITELEYDQATNDKRPCFIFLLDEEADWKPKFIDKDQSKINQLKEKLKTNHTIKFFSSKDELKALVSTSLIDFSPTYTPEKIDQYETFLKADYLNWVMLESGLISLSGIDPETPLEKREDLNLGSIYTALLTQTTIDKEIHYREKETQYLTALEVLNNHQHVVLLGDPGSGKSTFVNFVSWCLAGEAINNPYANIDKLTSPLPDDDGKETDKRQHWNHGALVPVKVILREFVACSIEMNSANACADSLWQFIAHKLKGASLEDYIPYLKKELRSKGGIILLDGLDEVPEANNRRLLMKEIIDELKSSFNKCRILVTSRTYAYLKQDFQVKGLQEAVLSPFTPGQIRSFIDMWYVHIAEIKRKSLSDAKGRAESLKYAIFHNARIRELADRPLLLTLISSLHAWRGGSLPEKREELYSSAVELLLDLWQKETVVKDENDRYILIQPSLLEWLKTDRNKMRVAIEKLAYEAHKKQPEMVGTADIAESDLLQGIIQVCNNPEVKPLRLIEFLRDRAGLLIQRGVSVYTFPHRTFQEYLTACYLTRKNYPVYIAKLAKESPDRWREIALLAGAKSASGGPFAVWALADELCYRRVGSKGVSIKDYWGAYLAGQILAESAEFNSLSARNIETVERIKGWLLKIIDDDALPSIERINAGNILDILGDVRFNKDYCFLFDDPCLGFKEIPEGKFLMGSDEKKDKKAYNDETPQHTIHLDFYYMSIYPVTVLQFQKYIEISGQTKDESWRQYNRYGNHPVVMINWFEAIEYCKWLSRYLKTSQDTPKKIKDLLQTNKWYITLPSEAEWEKSARGTDGKIYPWGDKFDKDLLNFIGTQIRRPSPVGCFKKGASPNNVMEMSGNVWEWTRSIDKAYPYELNDKREDLSDRFVERVVRGGSCYYPAGNCRISCRYRSLPDNQRDDIGFRLCLTTK